MGQLEDEVVIRALQCLRDAKSRQGSDVLPKALDVAIELARSERGYVVVPKGKELRIIAGRAGGQDVSPGDRYVSKTLVAAALERSLVLKSDDPRRDPRFRDAPSLQGLTIKNALVVPLLVGGEKLGAAFLANHVGPPRFAEEEVELVAIFATALAAFLEAFLAKERRDEPGRGVARLVGVSRPMVELRDRIKVVAGSEYPVLLLGETGTGKELVARAIHEESLRARKPFRAINVTEVADNLLESELFGHVPGAFTGANDPRPGIIREAHGSTLLLDEIGELPLDLQAKILRFLQEREVRPTGADKAYPVDVRVVAATHRDLESWVAKGKFRRDLFMRLNVLPVHTPPLRDRREDLPGLLDHFLRASARESRKAVPGVSEAALETILRHKWSGNVRELENAIRRAVVLGHDPIRAEDLELGGKTGKKAVEAAVRFKAALDASDGNISKACLLLGLHRSWYSRFKRLHPELFPG